MIRVRAIAAIATLALGSCAMEAARAPITGREQSMLGTEAAIIIEHGKIWHRAHAALAVEKQCPPHPTVHGCIFVGGPYRQRTLAALRRLVPAAVSIRPEVNAQSWLFELSVLNFSDKNAYALAGGKIFIMRGMIDAFALDDLELASLIAHELAHSLAQHQREAKANRLRGELAGALPRALIFGLTGIDPKAITDAVFSNPHSREQEIEADKIALTILARARYSPFGLVRLLDKLAQSPEGEGGFFSTHPAARERSTLARAAIENDPELFRARFY